MTGTQRAQYEADVSHIKNYYTPEALKRTGRQELEKGRLMGNLNDPYYNTYRELAKSGDYSKAVGIYRGYLADKEVAEGIRQRNIASRIEGVASPAGVGGSVRSRGGGGGGGGVGGGMFIGGTAGVYSGSSQYQNYLNNQGQPTAGTPAASINFSSRGGRGRKGAIQSAYRKILAANSAPPSATPTAPSDVTTAARVDDNGLVYGMGVVPSSTPTFKAPQLSRFENKKLKQMGQTPESLYARGIQQNPLNNQYFGQPPIINSPFFGQSPTMGGRFGGQAMSPSSRQFSGVNNPYTGRLI